MIEIVTVVIEIRGVENGDLAVPVNNTLLCHMSFLAAETTVCLDTMCNHHLYCNDTVLNSIKDKHTLTES